MKKNDKILILFLVVVILIGMAFTYMKSSSSKEKVVIYVDNKVYKEIDINKNEKINIKTDHGYNEVKVHNHGVEVINASCPDSVCIKNGFIDKSNQNIVCVPNKVVIKIVSDKKEEVDTIVN